RTDSLSVSSHAVFDPLLPSALLPAFCFAMLRLAPRPTLFPYTTLFRSIAQHLSHAERSLNMQNIIAQVLEIAPRLSDEVEHIVRSEEHTSELQSREKLVCRLLLEKKKITDTFDYHYQKAVHRKYLKVGT